MWARDLLETTINRWPGPFRFELDATGAALLTLLVLACAFAFGAASAWSATRQVYAAPHAGARRAPLASGRPGLRAGLAVFEVAIAVVVLVGTGLMLKGALRVAMQPASSATRDRPPSRPGGWVYLPHAQRPFTELILMIRFKGDVAPVIRGVQQAVWQDEPALPVHWNHLLDDLIAERYPEPRVNPRIFSVFAVLALVVALVGVYGVVAYASAGRAREFGIRLAVGSPRSKVWQLVVRQGVGLAVTGTAIGMLAALGLMHLAATVFFGVSPTDGWVYASCGLLAVAAVLTASAVPALRASRIDPVTVLRSE